MQVQASIHRNITQLCILCKVKTQTLLDQPQGIPPMVNESHLIVDKAVELHPNKTAIKSIVGALIICNHKQVSIM
jgi:hypothetical protein